MTKTIKKKINILCLTFLSALVLITACKKPDEKVTECITLKNNQVEEIEDYETISSFTSSELKGNLKSIELKNIDITHSWIGDLDLRLVCPGGETVKLISNSECDEANLKIGFKDTGISYEELPCPPIDSELYKPYDSSFEEVIGKAAIGNWELRVTDKEVLDYGTLNSWEIKICAE